MNDYSACVCIQLINYLLNKFTFAFQSSFFFIFLTHVLSCQKSYNRIWRILFKNFNILYILLLEKHSGRNTCTFHLLLSGCVYACVVFGIRYYFFKFCFTYRWVSTIEVSCILPEYPIPERRGPRTPNKPVRCAQCQTGSFRGGVLTWSRRDLIPVLIN